MSGHNVEIKEDFISFEHDAKKIEDYILSRYGKEIFAVYGMSMGGVLVATLWQNNRLSFEKVIFDGSPLVSFNCFVKIFMKKFYLNITHKTQKRDAKTVKQATKVIISKDNLEHFLKVIDNMTDETIKNVIDCIASFKLYKNINTPNTKLYFFHGTASNEIIAKKSAKYLKKYYPHTSIKCFKGKFHCENALFNQKIMIEELDKIFNR